MSKKLKVLVILLVICMVSSILTGCQNGTKVITSSSGTGSENISTKKTVLRVGLAGVGRKELPEGSGEYQDDCWATDYIKEKFGEPNNIDVQFELIEDTNDSSIQNYQLMMAAKAAPDLFYMTVGSVATVSNMAMNGALADLSSSLDKYGSHIKEFLGEDFINQYGKFYGNLVTIPGQESIPAISHYWIRTDWLKALGLEMPTNFDEWYSTMKAFKDRAAELEAAGCVTNAEDVVPYAMYHTKYFTDWERIVTRFYPNKYFDSKNMDYYIYSGYGIEYNKEGFKEGMQFMNTMYHEGLISENFALDSDKAQFKRDIVNGNAGSYCDNLFSGWGTSDDTDANWQTLCKQNIPTATFEYCNPFTNQYDNIARNPLDSSVLTYAFVPVYSKAVDEAIKYLDFVCQTDNMVAIQYGIEGETYTMDPVLGPLLKDADTLTAWGHRLGGRDLVMIGRLPNPEWSRIQRSHARTAEEAAYAEKAMESIEENGYVRFPIEISGVPEKASYGGALRSPWEKFLSSLIMAKDGQFDSAWDAGVEELAATGSDKLVEANKKQMELMGISD